MKTMQISKAVKGERMGPNAIGEENEMIMPTYRLKSGAGNNLEMSLAIRTFVPAKSRYSSANFKIHLALPLIPVS